jgi:hypothetical protein
MGLMIPKTQKLKENEKKEVKEFYPPFIAEKMIELNTHPEINEQPNTKIQDFYNLYTDIWMISNKPYQKKYWADPRFQEENYMETMEEFLSIGEGVLEANKAGRVSMTPKQREMLEKFYDMMDGFDGDGDSADDPGYGVNDAAIIEDPKFDKCRQYAKLVYEELSGDDLNAWEQQRSMSGRWKSNGKSSLESAKEEK